MSIVQWARRQTATPRPLWVASAIVLGAALLVSAAGCTPQQVMETQTAIGLNHMRADNGLPPLTVDPTLSAVSRTRAADMAAKGYFSHSPPDGCDFRCLFAKSNVTAAWSGEVIAWNDFSAADTVNEALLMWQDSTVHFDLITNRCFTRMGTGVATAPDGRNYYVAVFEGRAPGC